MLLVAMVLLLEAAFVLTAAVPEVSGGSAGRMLAERARGAAVRPATVAACEAVPGHNC
jgi:hypothetical protein